MMTWELVIAGVMGLVVLAALAAFFAPGDDGD